MWAPFAKMQVTNRLPPWNIYCIVKRPGRSSSSPESNSIVITFIDIFEPLGNALKIFKDDGVFLFLLNFCVWQIFLSISCLLGNYFWQEYLFKDDAIIYGEEAWACAPSKPMVQSSGSGGKAQSVRACSWLCIRWINHCWMKWDVSSFPSAMLD